MTEFPDDKLQDIMKAAAPGAKIFEQADGDSMYFYDGSRLVGYHDSKIGETAVFAKLGSLKPHNVRFNADILETLAKDTRIVPSDGTTHSIVIGSRFGGSQQMAGQEPTAPATYLVQGTIQRQIVYEAQSHPVCGPGSKGVFSFGSDGQIKSMTHRWRSAKNDAGLVAPLSQEGIQRQIEAQLAAANLTSGLL